MQEDKPKPEKSKTLHSQGKVLIVDDDQTLCEMYSERLKADNFDVVLAKDGAEGLRQVVKFDPDIILLDLMMPRVSGFDVLDILKSSPKTKQIPIIVLTALIQDESREQSLRAGADDYIVKSETIPAEVVSKIKKILQRKKKKA